MATGPEHYAAAEQLLADVRKAQASMIGKPSAEHIAQFLAQAQVHATLALTAATALGGEQPVDDYDQWRIAAATKVYGAGRPDIDESAS